MKTMAPRRMTTRTHSLGRLARLAHLRLLNLGIGMALRQSRTGLLVTVAVAEQVSCYTSTASDPVAEMPDSSPML